MNVANDWSSSLGTDAASSSLGAGDGSGDGSGDAPNGDDGTDESGVSGLTRRGRRRRRRAAAPSRAARGGGLERPFQARVAGQRRVERCDESAARRTARARRRRGAGRGQA